MLRTIAAASIAMLAAGAVLAACPEPAAVDALVQSYMTGEPAAALMAGAPMEDALCAQGMLVERLAPTLGTAVGYKAGLTSPAMQERFGLGEPVHGVLLAGMMLADGATVPAAFGARPIVEADLLLVVGDAAINAATTPEEILAGLSSVRPFIELADLVVAEGEPFDGSVITAINVGARMGVMGADVAVTPEMAEALAGMTVTLGPKEGEPLSEAPGAAILGNPLNAIAFLTGAGIELKPGDLVSAGSFGAPQQPQAGQTLVARYVGLPGDPSVSVTFE